MSMITSDQLAGMQELTEYELGFIDAVLYRMGILGRDPSCEEFAAAMGELEDFVSRHQPQLTTAQAQVSAAAGGR